MVKNAIIFVSTLQRNFTLEQVGQFIFFPLEFIYNDEILLMLQINSSAISSFIY